MAAPNLSIPLDSYDSILTASEKRIKEVIEVGDILVSYPISRDFSVSDDGSVVCEAPLQTAVPSWLIGADELEEVGDLGEGSFGKVKLCHLNCRSRGLVGQKVVVKRIPEDLASSRKGMACFVTECLLLRSLKDRSNIVDFLGISVEDARNPVGGGRKVQLVQEFCDQGCLGQLLLKQMKMTGGKPTVAPSEYSIAQAVRWVMQVARALSYLHNCTPPVVHRDVKPDNIFLTQCEDGKVVAKLGDFGSAKRMRCTDTPHSENSPSKDTDAARESTSGNGAENTASGRSGSRVCRSTSSTLRPHLKGSKMYMAPEILNQESYTEKVDIFSLGVTLYEVLHSCIMVVVVSESEHSIEEGMRKYIRGVVSGARTSCLPDLAPDLWEIITRFWAHNPDDRPTAEQAAKMLEAALLNLETPRSTPTKPTAPEPASALRPHCCRGCNVM